MKYLISISILFFFIACGNQDFEKVDIRLLNSKKSIDTVEPKKELMLEENSSKDKIVEKNISEPVEVVENLPLPNDIEIFQDIEVQEENESMVVLSSLDETKSIDSPKNNDSIVVSIDTNKTTTKSEKLQLAELEAKTKSETLSIQSKYDILVKKMEVSNAKLLTGKEIALAKLDSQKEIEKTKSLNKKELSLVEIESRQKIALAEIKSKKELSDNRKELDKEKVLNDKEVALAKLQTQKDISQNEEKVAITKAINDKEIALAKLENQKELADKNIAFYKMIAIFVASLIVLVLLIIYFINRRKRKNELKIHEDELRHREYMEASKQHNEHVKKMLDIITDESADKGVKKEIVRLLKEQGKKGNLIEHKK